ncbi:MAG: hypothetical protein B7Z36_04550 [Novosphingobium sp. 12-63-9]|nr:MAG: hypothetical protein B7Z36_04550 [Novosphingobium sp. 12-63-9]
MIDNTPLVAVGGGLFAVMALAYAGAFALRTARSRKRGDAGSTDESYVLSGVFGLLALLMAFAFSLAIGRYENRRELAIEEANAIGTMSTRLALLDAGQRMPLANSLSAYAALRAETGRVEDDALWQASATRAAAQCGAFGDGLFTTLHGMPPDTRAPLLVQAYNDMCDIATSRHAARTARLPGEVLLLLALYCCAGAAMLGTAHGGTGQRHLFGSALFFALLAAAFTTVLDLDRPRGGAILVPQDELETVAAGLSKAR